MKIIGTVESRINSTRLPAKALLKVNGKPLVRHAYDALKQANVDNVVVITTPISYLLLDYCYENNLDSFYDTALDDDDLLGRLCGVAKAYKADIIVRVWGDNISPFPENINYAIAMFKGGKYDYVVAHTEDSYCAVMSTKLLYHLEQERLSPNDKHNIHLFLLNRTNSINMGDLWINNKYTIDNYEDIVRWRENVAFNR